MRSLRMKSLRFVASLQDMHSRLEIQNKCHRYCVYKLCFGWSIFLNSIKFYTFESNISGSLDKKTTFAMQSLAASYRLPSFLSSKLHYNFVAILAHHCHMLKYRWHAQPKHQSALHIWFGNRRISPWCGKNNLIIWVFTIPQRWSLIPWHIWVEWGQWVTKNLPAWHYETVKSLWNYKKGVTICQNVLT